MDNVYAIRQMAILLVMLGIVTPALLIIVSDASTIRVQCVRCVSHCFRIAMEYASVVVAID